MSTSIDTRNWRYATKKFDTTKKISASDLEIILEAGRLTASSYGLQPYHIFVITDPELRAQLKPASWNQAQVTDASHLLVIASQTTFGEELVDDYINTVSETRGVPVADLGGYADFMKSSFANFSEEQKAEWATKQAYIVLGNLLQVAAELNIDSCAMEGFDKAQYNKILGLDAKNLSAAVLLPIGYRSEEDDTQHYAKVRKSKETLFTHL
ncbi:MAG: NAD(P)H-dependent oxidoreductase [Aureispira sp.]